MIHYLMTENGQATQNIYAKSYSREFGLLEEWKLKPSSFDNLDVYEKEICSVLELAVPAWHSGITWKQSGYIERIQKVAVRLLLSIDWLLWHTLLLHPA